MKGLLSLLIPLILTTLPVHAWKETGHMLVTSIAKDHLDPGVLERAEELLAPLAKDFPRASDFITAACWADDISKGGLKALQSWHSSPRAYPRCATYGHDWDMVETAERESKDLFHAISNAIETLSNPSAGHWEKGFMLRILLHCIGDAHMPCHCVNYFGPQFPFGDQGGKLFKLKGVKSLHSFWDTMCGLAKENPERPLTAEGQLRLEALKSQIYALYPIEALPESEELLPGIWIDENYWVGIEIAYTGILPGESPSDAYVAKGQQTALRQVALAGYRLAGLLNELLAVDGNLAQD